MHRALLGEIATDEIADTVRFVVHAAVSCQGMPDYAERAILCAREVGVAHAPEWTRPIRTSGAPRRAASAERSSGWCCDSRSAATRLR